MATGPVHGVLDHVRRAALREQQKLERLAADDVFKLLAAEETAREATAALMR